MSAWLLMYFGIGLVAGYSFRMYLYRREIPWSEKEKDVAVLLVMFFWPVLFVALIIAGRIGK